MPIAAFHRLIPFAILGLAINAGSGTFFLMTEPDQYVYTPAFHLKMLCVILAGANVVLFYLTMFRRVDPGDPGPWVARLNGAVSFALWITVIVCGRMITFYRPARCRPGQVLGFIADCIVRQVCRGNRTGQRRPKTERILTCPSESLPVGDSCGAYRPSI